MSTVREWGATFWVARNSPGEIKESAAVITRMALLDEVPDAVILDEKVSVTTPETWGDPPEDYDFLGVLITYRSESQDAAA